MQAVGAIQIQRRRAEQGRQLAGRRAPQQIHLEKSFLSVDEAGGAGDIKPVGATDDRYAQRVAFDNGRRAQSGQYRRAIQLRQAAVQSAIQPDGAAGQQRQQADTDLRRPVAPPKAKPRPVSSCVHAMSLQKGGNRSLSLQDVKLPDGGPCYHSSARAGAVRVSLTRSYNNSRGDPHDQSCFR